MSVISQQAWANKDVAFFLRADLSTLNVNSISTGSVVAGRVVSGDLSTNTLSSGTAFIHDVEASTIVAQTLQLDAQVLTADNVNLYLNGIPLVTTQNISSLQDWALDPAISTLQMNGNNILNASTISCITLVANQGIVATNLNVGNGIFNNLVAFNSLFVSTATSTISSLIAYTDIENASTLNANYISSGNAFLDNMSSSQGWIGSLSSGTVQVGTLEASSGLFSSLSTGVLAVNTLSTNNIQVSTLFADNWISTPNLYVSSINGAEFTSTTLKIEVAGVSSLTANFISSLGAELRTALVSTLQFNPSFSPSLGGVNVNLGLGSILGNVIGWGAGVFGAAAGTVGLATGMSALAMGRQQDYIDNTKYELINGTTQVQFSTLGTAFSTIYRFSASPDPERIPGSTIFISTIYPAGLAVRSMSDPLNTVSTPNSTIQSFGQWVAVPPELVNTSTFGSLTADRITTSSIVGGEAGLLTIGGPLIYLSTAASGLVFTDGEMDALRFESGEVWTSSILTSSISASTLTTTTVLPQGSDIMIRQAVGNEMLFTANEIRIDSIGASMTSGDNAVGFFVNGLTSSLTLSASANIDLSPGLNGPGIVQVNGNITANVANIEKVNASQNSWLSTVSTAIIYGANPNVFAPALTGNAGLKLDAPLIFLSTAQTAITGLTNCSTIGALLYQGRDMNISTVFASNYVSTSALTVSSINGFIYTPITNAYSSNVLWPNLSTTANVIASTSITTYVSSYIIANANTTIQNTTNQYHDSFFLLTIDGSTGPSTVTTAVNKTGSHLGQTISYRAYLGPGTWPITAQAYADANGDLTVTQIELSALGGLQ